MKQVLFVLLLFCSVSLFAQTEVSQVNHLGDYTLNVPGFNPVFSTVVLDGSLVLFDWTYDNNNINIRKMYCSPEGVISPLFDVITCTNPSPWGSVPIFVDAVSSGLQTYFTVKTNSLILVFILPENPDAALPSLRVTENHGLSANPYAQNHKKLGNSIYYVSTSDQQLYRFDLMTNTQTVLFPYNGYQMFITSLGDDYLYIYKSYDNNFHYIIDSEGSVLNPIYNYVYPIFMIEDTEPDIGGGIYPTGWFDGALRTSLSGYITYQDNQLEFISLSTDPENGPSALFRINCIPLTMNRFICRETQYDLKYFQTYRFANGIYNADTNFPCITPIVYNAERLFRAGDRYIVGISVYPDNIRRYFCIDLQQQTIQTTIDSMEFCLPDYNFAVYAGHDHFYYVNGTDISAYAVERVTANLDETHVPEVAKVRSFPNPFKGSIEIVLKGNPSNPNVFIYNIKGQLVRKLIASNSSETLQHFIWDGKDRDGKLSPAGIYLYQVVGDHNRKYSGKMVKVE